VWGDAVGAQETKVLFFQNTFGVYGEKVTLYTQTGVQAEKIFF
jgi:hypothetical protein